MARAVKDKASDYDRVENDWYTEPRWATHTLLDHVYFRGDMLDPCCGVGNVAAACAQRGLYPHAADLMGERRPITWGGDFKVDVECRDFHNHTYNYYANVISNPPYKQAIAFIDRALLYAQHKVAVFVRTDFLASQTRYEKFNTWPVAQVLHICRRVPLGAGTHIIPKTGGQHDHCWLVLDHYHNGPPTAHWVMPRQKYLEAEPYVER